MGTMIELLLTPLSVAGAISAIVLFAISRVRHSQWSRLRSFSRVRGIVVDYALRWDESYQRNERHPVVEVVLPSGRQRATIESGFMRFNDEPTLKLGHRAWVYVDPEHPDTAHMLTSWSWALGISSCTGLAAGVVVLLMLLLR